MDKICILDGLDINYRIFEFKNNHYILFLHGNSSDLNSFETLFDASSLLQSNLIFVDLPGHGNSGKLRNYTINEMAIVINNFLTKVIPPNSHVSIVGHSLGGHVAINLLKFIEFNDLVLFGTPPLIDKNNHGFRENNLSTPLLKMESSREEIVLLFNEFKYSIQKQDYFMNSFNKVDPKMRHDLFNSLMAGNFLDELQLLSKYKNNINIIQCLNDSFIDSDYISDVLRNLKVNYYSLPLGHVPQIEDPKLFKSALLFLLKNK